MRYRRKILWAICSGVTLSFLCGLPAGDLEGAAPPPMHVGVATADITPEQGAAHDPLLAKAVVFRQGACQAALVMCDVCIVSSDLSGLARQAAMDTTGIPAANIAVAATHTHTGTTARKDAAERIADAVARAQQAARPVQLQAGMAEQKETISFNRRYLMKDGTIRFNPGVLNPDIVRPVGPIDPGVGILLFRDAASGKPLASLTNFALHLDTVGKYDEFSADYPYYLDRELKKEFGDHFVSVFGTGTCGDVNHVDVTRPNLRWKQTRGQTMLVPFSPKPTDASPSPITTEYLGAALAATVKAAVPHLRACARPSLAARSETIQAPLATFSEMDRAWAREAGGKEMSFLMRIRASRIRALEGLRQKYGETMPVEVQAFRLCEDTAIVAIPGEVFVELGLAIKKGSPFAHTLVIELANTREMSYVPTRKAFCEGDYEVVNSRLESGGGEMMVEAALRMLKHLHEEKP